VAFLDPLQPITQDAVTRKDFALFDAVLNAFAPGATKGGEAVGAYQAISFVGLALKDYKGPATAAGFRAAYDRDHMRYLLCDICHAHSFFGFSLTAGRFLKLDVSRVQQASLCRASRSGSPRACKTRSAQ